MDRLEQLYVDMPTEGFFSTPKYVQVPYKPPPPKVFIETTTQDQLEDIESTKQKITENLQKINGMQKKAFKAQKRKMKICYDFFGKYEGSRQSTDWARSFWFGLHYVEPPKRYDPRKPIVEKKAWIPKEWKKKMRLVRPDDQYIGMDPNGGNEVRKNLKGYEIQKQEWETYVDAQWKHAFKDAFGVSEFRAFLATIPEKINVDLDTTPADEVKETWFELYEQTKYYHEKISMDHVHLYGPSYDEIVGHLLYPEKKKEIAECKKKPKIVQQLYDEVLDLQDNCEILKTLSQDGWTKNNNIYTRYDPIRRINIQRAELPVKMKRSSKSTTQKDKVPTGETKTTVKPKKPTDNKKPQVAVSSKEKKKVPTGETKTTVKPQKPTDNKKPQVAVTNTGKDKAPTINNKKK